MMILAMAMKIMKMGVKRTVIGSPTKRCPQDDAIQSALLFAQQSEVVLALAIALPLLAMGVVKEGTRGKEEGDPLLHLLLHPILQAMMQVHKKLAPLHHLSTSWKALSFAMLLCISQSLLDIGGLL